MIDAHRHFWRYSPSSHPWIDESMPMLKRDFLPGDPAFADPLAPDLAFAGCIAVQALHDPEETTWLLALAARHPQVLGVVGWVDLCGPDAGARLDELACDAHFVGVRHLLQDERDPRFCLRDDFRRGLQELCARELAGLADLGEEQVPRVARALGVGEPRREAPRVALVLPRVEAALEGRDVFVAELGEALRGEGAAAATGAVHDDASRAVGLDALDAQLEEPAGDGDCVAELSRSHLVGLANVDDERWARRELRVELLGGDLLDQALRLGEELVLRDRGHGAPESLTAAGGVATATCRSVEKRAGQRAARAPSWGRP